jgi:hypothetical protein
MNLQDVANPQTGTRDTLRHGLKSGNGDAGTVHALQSRLEQVSPLFLFLYDYLLYERCLIKNLIICSVSDRHLPLAFHLHLLELHLTS